MPSAWPTKAQVDAYVAAAGLTVGSIDATSLIASAVAEIERMTGWAPFLASSSATRTFDPPGSVVKGTGYPGGGGNLLKLRCGLISVSALTANGVSMTEGTDFWLGPGYAAPYQTIRFARPIIGAPRSVSITGIWGYSATIPDDVWQACMDMAASYVADAIAEGVASGATEWKELESSEKYDPRVLGDLGTRWSKAAEKRLSRFPKRIPL